MTNKTIVVLIASFIALILGLFALSYVQKQKTRTEAPVATTTGAVSEDPYHINRIDAKHFYRNGIHTIVGELTMPTPCDLLTTDAVVMESMPEQVVYTFKVINTTTDCEVKSTKQRFSVEAEASDQASLAATFRGMPIELNLVEAGADETPESYELFIKG